MSVASGAGHEALHVADVGKAGWKDWNGVRYASDGDFVLVTNDTSDYRRLYAKQLLHAGLVIIIRTSVAQSNNNFSAAHWTYWRLWASRSTVSSRSTSRAMSDV